MNKSEFLANLIDRYTHLKPQQTERAVNILLDQMTRILGQGGRIEIRGFGSFSVRKREARLGRNPRTGEAVQLTDKIAPYFKPGKVLRARLIQAKLKEIPLSA